MLRLLSLEAWISAELRTLGIVPDPVPQSEIDLGREISLARTTGRFRVWAGASTRTIWSGPAANYRFRALHDVQHYESGSDFSLAGEQDAAQVFIGSLPRSLRRRYGRLLTVEIAGQAEEFFRTGAFPEDQVSFNLSRL